LTLPAGNDITTDSVMGYANINLKLFDQRDGYKRDIGFVR